MRLDHGNTYNVFYISIGVGKTGWAIQDFPVHDNNLDYYEVPIAPGQRYHVHFEVEVGGRSRFFINGVLSQDHPTPAFVVAGQPTVGLGLGASTAPNTPMNIGYGHVVFTAE